MAESKLARKPPVAPPGIPIPAEPPKLKAPLAPAGVPIPSDSPKPSPVLVSLRPSKEVKDHKKTPSATIALIAQKLHPKIEDQSQDHDQNQEKRDSVISTAADQVSSIQVKYTRARGTTAFQPKHIRVNTFFFRANDFKFIFH